MKRIFLVGFAVLGLLYVSGTVMAEQIDDTTVLDPAFEAYVSRDLLQQATGSTNPELLTDVALQLAEGERVLMRSHLGVSSEEVLRLAYRLATEEATKARLKKAAEKAEKKNLLDEFAKIDQESKSSMAAISVPKFSIEENTQAEVATKDITEDIEKAVLLQDRAILSDVESKLEESKDVLGEKVFSEVSKFLADVKSKIAEKPSEETNSLAKLDGVSRQMGMAMRPRPIGPGQYPGAQRPSPMPGGMIPSRPTPQGPHTPDVRPPVRPEPPRPPQGIVPQGRPQRPFDIDAQGHIQMRRPEQHNHGEQAYRVSRPIPTNVTRTAEKLKNGTFRFEQTPTFRAWTQAANRGVFVQEAEIGGRKVRVYQSVGTRKYNPNWPMTAQWIMWAPPLIPNVPLSPWRQQVYDDAEFASTNWGIEYPISPRTGLQYFPDSSGSVIVVGVATWSPVQGIIRVGDIITSVDNMPINMPWDMEKHFRLTWFEHIDLDTMWWQMQPAWLGMF